MRWFWIDRFEEFESGKRAVAIKNVSLAEEHMHDHFPGFSVMPGSLMLEGMAQTGGILLGENSNFEHFVILAKMPKAVFHDWVVPGDTIRYTATLVDVQEAGGRTNCVAHVGDRLVAECEILFAHLDQSDSSDGDMPNQKNFVFSVGGLLDVLDVGKMGASEK